MQYTALSTHPTLQGKSREIRLLFADTANEALAQGRSESEAIFKALNIVKLKEQQSIKKFVPQSVPAHLAAILNVRSASNLAQEALQAAEIEKATLSSQQPSNEVVDAKFDPQGRLILKLKDGKTITSNVAPITAVETNVVVVGSSDSTTTVDPDLIDESLDGGSATSVFKPLEIVDGGGAA